MKKDKWVWMPHAGHLCVANRCRFHLNTYVGKYLVSTVGEYYPNGPYKAPEEIGSNRFYETFVFNAQKGEHACCPWEQADGCEIDSEGYNDAGDAYKGHMKMCLKWSKKS